MAKQDDEGKQFINDLAAMIAEQTLASIIGIDATVKGYVNKHLGQIIDVGLGVEKAWHERKDTYRFIGTNGFVGPLKEFIQQLGAQHALESAPKHVKELTEKRLEAMLEHGLGKEGQQAYADAYAHAMMTMCNEMMKSSEAAFIKRLEGAVTEAMSRTNALVAERVDALIRSMQEGTKK